MLPHMDAPIAGEQAPPSTESGVKKIYRLGAGAGGTPLKHLGAVIKEERRLWERWMSCMVAYS